MTSPADESTAYPAMTEDQLPRLPVGTALDGVFAAGDIRVGSMKRVAAAIGEGSPVIRSVHLYLASYSDPRPRGEAIA
jgi:thioredoxin reductase (NADPH)